MGEVCNLVNPAKRQYIDTDGLSGGKFHNMCEGDMGLLISLLLHTPSPELPQHPLVASWCGDTLIAAGDCSAPESFFGERDTNEDVRGFCTQYLDDITPHCVDMLCRMDPSYADDVARIPDTQPLFEGIDDIVSLYKYDTLKLFGSALLLYHTPAIYHAMLARLGPGWIDSYRQLYTLLAQERERYGESTRNLIDPAPYADALARLAPPEVDPPWQGRALPASRDTLIANPARRAFFRTAPLRTDAVSRGFIDTPWLRDAMTTMIFDPYADKEAAEYTHRNPRDRAIWYREPFMLVGHDAPAQVAGIRSSAPQRGLYEHILNTWDDVTSACTGYHLDRIYWQQQESDLSNCPIDFYYYRMDALLITEQRMTFLGMAPDVHNGLGRRLRYAAPGHTPEARAALRLLTQSVVDHEHHPDGLAWLGSVESQAALEEDLHMFLTEELFEDLDCMFEFFSGYTYGQIGSSDHYLKYPMESLRELLPALQAAPDAPLRHPDVWRRLADLHPHYDGLLMVVRNP